MGEEKAGDDDFGWIVGQSAGHVANLRRTMKAFDYILRRLFSAEPISDY